MTIQFGDDKVFCFSQCWSREKLILHGATVWLTIVSMIESVFCMDHESEINFYC